MREEQKIVRQWAQSQTEQQTEIRRLLSRARSSLDPPPPPPPSISPTNKLRTVIRPAVRRSED
jgi:hypothetical protein